MILLLYMLWFYAPLVSPLPPYQAIQLPRRGDETSLLINDFTELANMVVDSVFPIPFYFHLLRSHRQSSDEKARFISLQSLRYSGYRRDSFCSNEDFTKISKIHSSYQTKRNDCSAFPDGYIAVGYNYDRLPGNYYIEELYIKYDNGRLDLVISAKKFRPIPAQPAIRYSDPKLVKEI